MSMKRALPPQSEIDLALRLYHAKPHYSARRVFSIPQIAKLYFVLSAVIAGLIYAPGITASLIVGALTLFYLASFAFKVFLFLASPSFEAKPDLVSVPADRLPVYTILVPLFAEAPAIPALIRALSSLDYPAERLDVKFIVEEDDAQTRAVVSGLLPGAHAEIIVVPPGKPRTKPKALLYGLAAARGAFVVVYDAEDQPEPQQLRRALARFEALGPDTACLQARLNLFNARENWLCRLFAIDYCLWFDYLLPGLERFSLPIPLGGTSNHFRREALEACGGWDPFNVTEDADLGIRLAREGFRVGTLDSTTFEEAPVSLAAWLAQRARWIKGYMQTALVHSRARTQTRREIGLPGLLVIDLFLLGTAIAGLANPVLWGLFIGWLVSGTGVLGGFTGPALLALSLLGLVGGNAMIVFLSLIAPLRRGWLDLIPFALSAPFYWLLISLAAWRGLAGLLVRPFHWSKTPHGQTAFVPKAAPSHRDARS